MTSWSRGHLVTPDSIAHSARVAAAVAQSADERRNRGLVALGLMRGHFGPDGSLCVGHLRSEHTDAADQLDPDAADVAAG